MMQGIMEIYDKHNSLGIKNRRLTVGKELELVKEYIEYRKEMFQVSPERELAIFLESKIDNAYPDIVFVEYNPENYSDWNEARCVLNKNDFKILYHICARNGLQASDIVSQLGVTWKEAMISIERLYDSNLITRTNKNWMLVDEKKISTYKIEAVEAKLNHWDQVLQQTIINKNFASESYALSIAKSMPRKDVLAKFKRFGVGLCLKNGSNFDVIKKAQKKEIPVSFNSILFNEWVGRILNEKEVHFNAI